MKGAAPETGERERRKNHNGGTTKGRIYRRSLKSGYHPEMSSSLTMSELLNERSPTRQPYQAPHGHPQALFAPWATDCGRTHNRSRCVHSSHPRQSADAPPQEWRRNHPSRRHSYPQDEGGA
ncbi:hypothetical protein GCM10010357_17670 [Streptomyces luteireticuli]|uniref:Uncharacterized protein n=1 Tax=Streptomyces luteireticuli TaxID=173858 RepID=A0ABP3IBN2_9ACTN